MPAIARVLDNEVRSDGTIRTTVLVTALNETQAVSQAKSGALRHNGYSDVFLNPDSSLNVEDLGAVSQKPMGLREDYIVIVEITGAGEFLQRQES